MKRPSFQFYPGDWLNDAALRMVSVGARGLWIEMICLMHQGSEYGYLKVNHKVILTPNLARMVGATLTEVEGWLVELEHAGVFSVDEDGCIYSRRMIRDEEVRQARAAGGKLGGNPNLLGSSKVDNKVNLESNLEPTPSSSSSSSSSNSEYVGSKLPDCPHEKILALYAEHLPVLPQPRIWNDKRRKLLASRWKFILTNKNTKNVPFATDEESGLAFFNKYFSYVAGCDFLMGRKTAWNADLPWLLEAENFAKVIEGNYQNKEAA